MNLYEFKFKNKKLINFKVFIQVLNIILKKINEVMKKPLIFYFKNKLQNLNLFFYPSSLSL